MGDDERPQRHPEGEDVIFEIGSLAVCGAAGFLFLRGFYHAGALTGWLVRNRPDRPPDRDGPPPALLDTVLAEQDRMWQREEERLFHQVPSAWWLDPKRWGTPAVARKEPYCGCGRGAIHRESEHDAAMGRRATLLNPQATYRIEPVMPRCPNCETAAAVIVLTTHGDTVSMWHCGHCMAEFTKKGETRKSKRARADRYASSVARLTADDVYPKLPCGCPHSTPVNTGRVDGWPVSVCGKCHAWWEFPSNSSDRRKLAQGSTVNRLRINEMPPPHR